MCHLWRWRKSTKNCENRKCLKYVLSSSPREREKERKRESEKERKREREKCRKREREKERKREREKERKRERR
jgi:hypothetical protein